MQWAAPRLRRLGLGLGWVLQRPPLAGAEPGALQSSIQMKRPPPLGTAGWAVRRPPAAPGTPSCLRQRQEGMDCSAVETEQLLGEA